MATLTTRQRAHVRKHTRPGELDASELDGELNIVPFLDIVVNLITILLMVTASTAFFSQVEVRLPHHCVGTGCGEADPLQLSVNLTGSGVVVAGSGGMLEPGCEATGAGAVAIPRAGVSYDWEALRECVSAVHARYPESDQVMLSADDTVPYEALVHAMDAVREDSRGRPLFPEVRLSAGVR